MSGKYKAGDKVWIRAEAVISSVDEEDSALPYCVRMEGSYLSWIPEEWIHGKVAGTSGLTTPAGLEKQHDLTVYNLNHLTERVDALERGRVPREPFDSLHETVTTMRREMTEQGQRLAALEVRDDRATKSDLATEHVRVDKHMQELMDRINGVQANLDITSRMALGVTNVDQRLRSLEQTVQALGVAHNRVATRVDVIREALADLATTLEGDDD